MTNADKFKQVFGLYATELWAMSETEFLTWLNADAEPSPKQHKSFDYPTELHPCAGCKWEDSLYIGCRMCSRSTDDRSDLWEAN